MKPLTTPRLAQVICTFDIAKTASHLIIILSYSNRRNAPQTENLGNSFDASGERNALAMLKSTGELFRVQATKNPV